MAAINLFCQTEPSEKCGCVTWVSFGVDFFTVYAGAGLIKSTKYCYLFAVSMSVVGLGVENFDVDAVDGYFMILLESFFL